MRAADLGLVTPGRGSMAQAESDRSRLPSLPLHAGPLHVCAPQGVGATTWMLGGPARRDPRRTTMRRLPTPDTGFHRAAAVSNWFPSACRRPPDYSPGPALSKGLNAVPSALVLRARPGCTRTILRHTDRHFHGSATQGRHPHAPPRADTDRLQSHKISSHAFVQARSKPQPSRLQIQAAALTRSP